MLLAPLVFGVLWLIVSLGNYEQVVANALLVGGLGIVAYAMTLPFMAVISAVQDLRKVAIAQFLVSLVNAVFIFGSIIFNKYIVFLSASIVGANLAVLIFYLSIIKRYLPSFSLKLALTAFDFSLIFRMMKLAYPFMLLVGFATVYNKIDVIIMKHFLGYYDVGLYSAAYKFFDVLGFFPAVVYASLYPFFSEKIISRDNSEIRSVMEKYIRFMAFIGFPMAVGGTLLAKPLITLIAGAEFTAASSTLAILVWASFVLFLYIPANALIIAHLTKRAAVVAGVNMAVNIMGNIILIPIIGIKAAAIMTVISESVQAFFYYFFIYRSITPFRFFYFVWKPMLGALVMGGGLWYFRDFSIFIALPLGVAIYFAAMAVFKFYKKEDLILIRTLFARKV